MTLTKRSLFLILPVVLSAYIIAATGIYSAQKNSILKNEQSRIELQLTELASSYQAYSGFADSYLFAILQGQTLSQYLTEKNNRYREIAFASNLEAGLSQLKQHDSDFISFAIINSDYHPEYYFESSLDPFAEISPLQIKIAADLFQKKSLGGIRHLILKNDRSLIIQNRMIDSRTLFAPIPSQLTHALVMQLAIEPTRFDELRKAIEDRYKTSLILTSDKLEPTTEPGARTTLGPGYYAILETDLQVISDQLNNLKYWLLGGLIFMSVSSTAILLWLIRRYITHPIFCLDKELTEVIASKRNNITLLHSNDEVARLSSKFYSIYDQLSGAYARTQLLSETDILTDLPNRAKFYDQANIAITHAMKRQIRLAVFYIDLDNFKFVNDKYGHALGDTLLRAFAFKFKKIVSATLAEYYIDYLETKSSASKTTALARLAGDEFAAVISTEKGKISSANLAREILAVFKNGFHFENGHFPVTVSIGIAHYPDDGNNINQLMSNADTAMYQAKAAGKNQLAYYSTKIAQQELRCREIEQELRKLRCDDEFSLVYMPIICATGKHVIGCEALLRWTSPVLSSVGPAEFIPISESIGFYRKIDFWVVSKALSDYKTLEEILGKDILLSINLSSANLHEPGIEDHIVRETNANGLSSHNIELEITETYYTDRSVRHLGLLKQLSEQGYNIAIDDFGTGYTSLSQMIEFPINKVKLDRTFIDQLFQSDRLDMLPFLVSLCQSQGIKVTAEGVETELQSQTLKRAGCNYLQGFLFAKPMSLDQLRDKYTPQFIKIQSHC